MTAAALVACGGGDATAPPADDFAGTWQATKVELVSAASSSVRVELVAAGAAFTLTLRSDHTFTLTGIIPGESPLTLTGTWTASADVFTMSFTSGLSGQWQFDYSLAGDVLTMNGANTDWDFDDDGDDDPARLNLVFVRS
jgi:hypothetical protein